MVTLADVRNNVGNQAIKAVFIRNASMPDFFIVGTIYSDDPELAKRLRDFIDAWGGSWTVITGDEMPDWMGEQFVEDESFNESIRLGYISQRFCYVSYEVFAFGDDIPVLVVSDSYYELKPVE